MERNRINLSRIRQAGPEIQWHQAQDILLKDIRADSRKVSQGTLFVALGGTRTDGIEYLDEAISKGASAVIAREKRKIEKELPFGVVEDPSRVLGKLDALFWGNPERSMVFSGVTGTNGKTTTTYLIRSILQEAGHKTGLFGTIGYQCEERFVPATHTTPDPLSLNERLAEMKEQGASHIAMEVSSHSLLQGRVAHLPFRCAVFTNLGRDHLDYHKTLEEYLDAKSVLFSMLSPDGHAILNHDDPASTQIAKKTRANLLFYGIRRKAQVFARNMSLQSDHTRFVLVTPQGECDILFHLPGEYNVYNALAAASCALGLGIPLVSIAKGIQSLQNVPGRLERIEEGQPFQVFVDYAHTSQAMESLLSSLYRTKRKRLLVVFGCGGDRDEGKRSPMGRSAAKYADFTWITNDNPRTESPEKIAKQVEEGFLTTDDFEGSGRYEICLDRKEAIQKAIAMAEEGDTVVIAGKGHETGQIVGKEVFPFDDREIAREFLAGRFRPGEKSKS